MSKLLEYIKLIPTAIQNADKIVEGVIANTKLKHGNLPPDEVEEIIRRRVICKACPYMSENAKKAGITTSKRPDEFCIQCNCNIDYKTSSLTSNCGIEMYNKRNPRNPIELKWTAYDKNKQNEQKTD